jgi:hypothetical protein
MHEQCCRGQGPAPVHPSSHLLQCRRPFPQIFLWKGREGRPLGGRVDIPRNITAKPTQIFHSTSALPNRWVTRPSGPGGTSFSLRCPPVPGHQHRDAEEARHKRHRQQVLVRGTRGAPSMSQEHSTASVQRAVPGIPPDLPNKHHTMDKYVLRTHTHTHTHTDTYPPTHTHLPTQAPTHTHTPTPTHIHTRTHTHIHTHTPKSGGWRFVQRRHIFLVFDCSVGHWEQLTFQLHSFLIQTGPLTAEFSWCPTYLKNSRKRLVGSSVAIVRGARIRQ